MAGQVEAPNGEDRWRRGGRRKLGGFGIGGGRRRGLGLRAGHGNTGGSDSGKKTGLDRHGDFPC